MNIVLTYFNPTLGPIIFFSIPDGISEDISKKILSFFNFELSEEFFEIVLVDENLKITNLYFEVQSGWARGGTEMVMISIIMDKEFKFLKKGEFFNQILKEISKKINETNNIYKAFYINSDLEKDDKEVNVKYDTLKEILQKYLNLLQQEFKSDFEPTKLLKKFKNLKW